MSKSFRRHKKSSRIRLKKRKVRSRSRKLKSRKLRSRSRKLKSRSRKLRGGNEDKVKCCICEKIFEMKDTFVPRECLIKNGKAAHRICQECWWNPNTGFALESSSHKCPGCQKGLPLTDYKKETPIFVDLTED